MYFLFHENSKSINICFLSMCYTISVVAKSPYEEYTEMQVKAAFEVFDEDQNGRAKFK